MGTYAGLRARRSASGGTQREPARRPRAGESEAARRYRRPPAAGRGAAGRGSLPLLTYVLTMLRPHLNLADDLLIYLVAVVTITVLGGFWPAVLAAVAASLLLNWYFTEPLHTFTIQSRRSCWPCCCS